MQYVLYTCSSYLSRFVSRHSVCWRFGAWDDAQVWILVSPDNLYPFDSKSLPCARASKLKQQMLRWHQVICSMTLLPGTHVKSLQWCHNELDGVSNHRRLGCLHERLLRRRSMKTSKLRVNGLCAGNSPVAGEFPAQKASNAENVPKIALLSKPVYLNGWFIW